MAPAMPSIPRRVRRQRMTEMTATPQRRGLKIEERGHRPAPEHEHGHTGELKADVDPDSIMAAHNNGPSSAQTDAVADDFTAKGLGRRAGDGQIRKDDLGQAGHLADVVSRPEHKSAAHRPLGSAQWVGTRSPVSRASEARRVSGGGNKTPQHGTKPDTIPRPGHDGEHHLLPRLLEWARGVCLGVEPRVTVETDAASVPGAIGGSWPRIRANRRRHHQQGRSGRRRTERSEVAVADHDDAEGEGQSDSDHEAHITRGRARATSVRCHSAIWSRCWPQRGRRCWRSDPSKRLARMSGAMASSTRRRRVPGRRHTGPCRVRYRSQFGPRDRPRLLHQVGGGGDGRLNRRQ